MSNKKTQKDISSDSESESESSQSDVDESSSEGNIKNINVEFEAQTPVENDFHGIKQLILRSIVLLHVDASELTDIIISQSSVGSTIKIVDDGEDEVYGIFSVVGLKKYSEKKCIKELLKELQARCKSCAKEKSKQFEEILKTKNIGYLISERFINIPAQLAVPFHSSLRDEVDAEKNEDPLYDFDYLLLLSKTLKPSKDNESNNSDSGSPKAKKKRKSKKLESVNKAMEYTNFEDELFHKESALDFSYSVTEATGLAVSGSWDFEDCPMKTYRTVMLIPTSKWKTILSSIKEMVDT